MSDLNNLKLYIAAPIVNISDSWKAKINCVINCFKDVGISVYNPAEHGVPNAWGMTMTEWSKCIFALDIVAIDNCDWVVVCDFGRDGTAGTAFEAGYAFGKNKKVLLIYMNDDKTNYSVMMNGCCSNSTSYDDLLSQYCDACAYDDINKEKTKKFMDSLFIERGRLQQDIVFN